MKSTANPSDFIFGQLQTSLARYFFNPLRSALLYNVFSTLIMSQKFSYPSSCASVKADSSNALIAFSLPDYLSNLRALRECFRWFRSDSVTTTLASSFHYMYAGWTWVVLRISNAGHQSLYRYSLHEPDDNSDRKPVIQIQTFRSLDWANTQVEAVHITRPNWFGVRMLWKHWAIHAAWIPETRSSASQQ